MSENSSTTGESTSENSSTSELTSSSLSEISEEARDGGLDTSELLDVFGFEDVSEDELRGITSEDEEEEADESEAVEEKSKAEPKTTDKVDSEDAKTTDKVEKKAEEKKEETKPEAEVKAEIDAKVTEALKGMVPIQAVREERSLNKSLREELSTLQEQLKTAKLDAMFEAKFENFKKLSDKEVDRMFDDDPDEARIYLKKEREYDKYQAERSLKIAETTESTKREAALITAAYDEIEEALPGIYDPNSKDRVEFMDFLAEAGFTSKLFSLLDPATKVQSVKGEKASALGELAPQLINVFRGLKAREAQVASRKSEADMRKEIEAEIRPIIEKELLQKLKADGKGTKFKSLTSLPKSDSQVPKRDLESYTDAELDKLADSGELDKLLEQMSKSNRG